MKIEDVIRCAIEGGYTLADIEPLDLSMLNVPAILLDPLFWQALDREKKNYIVKSGFEYSYWKIRWHQFISHLAEGGTIESFFESLN